MTRAQAIRAAKECAWYAAIIAVVVFIACIGV
jgi:hypothetical protein